MGKIHKALEKKKKEQQQRSKNHPERRQSNRCHLRAEGYRVMVDKTRATGSIRDISLGGLAFVYNPIEDHTFADRAIETLIIDYSGFQLWDISCDKIYDIRALSEGQTFSGATARRCGVRFVNLSILNKFKIKQIMHICRSRILRNVSRSKGRRLSVSVAI